MAKNESVVAVRAAGFYKVRNQYTASTYPGSDFEVAYWDGQAWSIVGWAGQERDSYFEVVGKIEAKIEGDRS